MSTMKTTRDVKGVGLSIPRPDGPEKVTGRVPFVGQPVLAVAADELSIAEEALDLITVEYEVLPASVDPLVSMQPGAAPVAEAGTKADTSEALAHSAVALAKSDAGPSKAV